MNKLKTEIQELLTSAETAKYLKVKENTLAIWRCTKRYPLAYIKIGSRVYYKSCDLAAFIEQQYEYKPNLNK